MEDVEAPGEVRALQVLEEDRGRTLRRLAALRRDHDAMMAASKDTNADDEHDPEGATIAFERSQLAAFAAQARQHLDEVEQALMRVEAGTYGSCVGCGGVVPEERLEARPVARTCVGCAPRP